MRTLLGLALVSLTTAAAGAQRADFQWSKAEPAGTVVSVHDINGDVNFVPAGGNTVEVTGHRHGSTGDMYVAVKEYAQHVVVCVLWKDTDESCDEDGAHMRANRSHWGDRGSVDVTVKLPPSMRADAHSVSGDVAIDGAQGDVRASSVSGNVHLRNLHASSVRATAVSGDVDVSIAAFTGTGDLSFRSVSGDVTVAVPPALDADFSMSTVSGDLDTDLSLTLNGRVGRRSIHARIGRGGRALSVSTVSGDVRLRTIK